MIREAVVVPAAQNLYRVAPDQSAPVEDTNVTRVIVVRLAKGKWGQCHKIQEKKAKTSIRVTVEITTKEIAIIVGLDRVTEESQIAVTETLEANITEIYGPVKPQMTDT